MSKLFTDGSLSYWTCATRAGVGCIDRMQLNLPPSDNRVCDDKLAGWQINWQTESDAA